MKKFISTLVFLVVLLVTSQQVFSRTYTGQCIPVADPPGAWLYLILDENGVAVYGELQLPNGKANKLFGDKPDGWLIDPNDGSEVDIWNKVDILKYQFPKMTTEEALSNFIPVVSDTLGGKVISRLDFSRTLRYAQLSSVASVQINQSNQQLSIITDKAIDVRVVNLLTGNVLAEFLNVIQVPVITIPGVNRCDYGLSIDQTIDGVQHRIRTKIICTE